MGIQIVLSSNIPIVDGETDDTETTELVLGVSDIGVGTHVVTIYLMNGAEVSGTFVIDIACSSLAPTAAPSPSPTIGDVHCGDTVIGDYNMEPISFTFILDTAGDFAVDASSSSGNWRDDFLILTAGTVPVKLINVNRSMSTRILKVNSTIFAF